jgi:hypothetical protein
MTNGERRFWTAATVVASLLLGGVSARHADAGLEYGDFFISALLRNQSEVRLGSPDPDRLMSFRNELMTDFSYTGIPHVKLFMRNRFFYDTVWDWENDGTGGAEELRDHWEHNLDMRAEERDPIFREVYADVDFGNFFGRFGRQLVSWGRADGVVLLDQINPTNFRRPLITEVEDIRIPLWMANLNYTWMPSQTLQVLWIPRYVPSASPGLTDVSEYTFDHFTGRQNDFHDWTLNAIKFRNIGLTAPLPSFTNPELIGRTDVRKRFPTNSLDNGEVAIRQMGTFYETTYTLNYFYSWTDIPGTYTGPLNDQGFPIAYLKPVRYQLFGFSLDRGWPELKGPLNNIVTRLEWAYIKDDQFVQFEGPLAPAVPANTVQKDHTGYLIGLDKIVYNPLLALEWFKRKGWSHYSFVSVQLAQDFIIDPIHHKNAYYDLGALNAREGMRDQVKTTTTFFLQQGLLSGQTLNFTLLVVAQPEFNDGWIRPEFTYDFTTRVRGKIGMNLFWGEEQDPLGQFVDNNQVFTEIAFSF